MVAALKTVRPPASPESGLCGDPVNTAVSSQDAAGSVQRADDLRVTTLGRAWRQDMPLSATKDTIQIFTQDAGAAHIPPAGWRDWINFRVTPEFSPENCCVSKISWLLL
jgi:hypothetical protein